MNRILWVCAALACVLPTVAGAGELVVDGIVESQNEGFRFPDGTVQTTAASSAEAREPISSLPFEITSSGSYYLTGNLSLSTGSDGIVVSANDVTLDLNGFLLNGSGTTGSGINLGSSENVEIRNGTVREFGKHGIAGSGNRTRILSMRLLGNFASGVALSTTARDHMVVDSTAQGNVERGIWLGINATVRRCIASGNGFGGIRVGLRSVVSLSTSTGNGGEGINANDESSVGENLVSENQGSGIRAEQGSRVTGNTVIRNNLADDFRDAGVRVFENTLVSENHLEENRVHGLRVSQGGNVIQNNSIIDNAGDGLQIDAGENIYVDNRFCLNTDNSDIAAGNLDGGGNLECP